MTWIYAICCAVVCGFCWLFMQDKPPTPPSPSATSPIEPFWVWFCRYMSFELIVMQPGVKKMCRIRAFWLLLGAIGLAGGGVASLLTLMQQILAAQGYTDVCVVLGCG